MNITEWLSGEVGRAAALSSHFNKSRSAISQWKTNGVPPEHMLDVRDFTSGVVTLEEMLAESAALRERKVA